MSRLCEKKVAEQLHGNRAADQRLSFCYIDNTIPLLPKSEISSSVAVQLAAVCVGPGRKPRRQVFSRRCSYSVTEFIFIVPRLFEEKRRDIVFGIPSFRPSFRPSVPLI